MEEADSTIWFIVGTYCIQCTGTDHSDVAGHWAACVWTWNRDYVWSAQAEVKCCYELTYTVQKRLIFIIAQIIYLL